MSIEKYVEELVGYIYSEDGIYEPSEITFTVVKEASIEVGDFVVIEHPSKPGIPIFYQVVEVPLRRRARDYEEDLARSGSPLLDETRDYPRARARQLGYIDNPERFFREPIDIDDLLVLVSHIRPLSRVYKPRNELISRLLEPSKPFIEVGSIYPSWRHKLYFGIEKLLRQGLLVVGGVGTGKTTTILTILVRLIREIKRSGGRPHILIIDKDGEYGSKELVEEAESLDGYLHIHVDSIEEEITEVEEYTRRLLEVLGYYDRRTKEAKAIVSATRRVLENIRPPYTLDPVWVEKHIVPSIEGDYNLKIAVKRKIEIWKKKPRGDTRSSSEELYTPSSVVEETARKTVVHIDLSASRSLDRALKILNTILRLAYERVLRDEEYGLLLVIDEAHLYAPESRGVSIASEETTRSMRDTLHLIATTGPRNGLTLFVSTQRPSLITKTITTQTGQNIIAHRVEDVDLARIEEIMGPIARMTRLLPRGWAIVKGLAAKTREPLIVRISPETTPTSMGKTAYYRWLNSTKNR